MKTEKKSNERAFLLTARKIYEFWHWKLEKGATKKK